MKFTSKPPPKGRIGLLLQASFVVGRIVLKGPSQEFPHTDFSNENTLGT